MRSWILLALLLALSFNAEAALVVSAQELLENPEQYDGKEVTYQGEAIGDILGRKEDFVWLNVHDGTGAIGIFCPRDLLSAIQFSGSYQFRGDLISVRGVFHQTCPEHGGDTDIHAEKVIILQRGEAITHPLKPEKIKISITLAATVLALAIIHLIVRRFR